MSAGSDVISQPGITRVAFDGVGQEVNSVFTLNQRRRLCAALAQTDTSGTCRPDHKVVVKCNLLLGKRRRSFDPLGEGNGTFHDSFTVIRKSSFSVSRNSFCRCDTFAPRVMSLKHSLYLSPNPTLYPYEHIFTYM